MNSINNCNLIQNKNVINIRGIFRFITKVIGLLLICISCNQIWSQNIHSHNDYYHDVPFWNAYSAGASSIEVDIFLKSDILYVTHEESEIIANRTIENLYLEPLQKAISLQFGRQESLQILIDIKSEAVPTIQKLMSTLKKYPDITNNEKITLAISGNRPPSETYLDYPPFIKFDLQNLEGLDKKALWDKVALISLNFKKISTWNGMGNLTAEDSKRIKAIIDKAHSYGKPFRFWATPDTKTSWRTLTQLGVDYINTDMPFECIDYLKSLDNN